MNFPNQISGTFNKPIALGVGTLKVYKGGALFLLFTEADVSVAGNSFSINVTNMFPDNGKYLVMVSAGLFTSGAESFAGVGSDEWTFTIAPGEYNNTEYSNEYLLN